MKKAVFATLIACAISSYASAGPIPSATKQGFFDQQIDHFVSPRGQNTFSQRYWVNSEYAVGTDAPVLLHVCGENAADNSYYLHDSTLEFARALGARIVYLEHRYYGPSQPFGDTSTVHLQYLTIDNVIEDLASFQKWITQKNQWTGKWISVGGSYSGTISALYRLRHPELVVGALASSATMRSVPAQEDPNADVSYFLPTQISDYAQVTERSWAYEACTNFQFWVAYRGTVYQPGDSICQQTFGIDRASDGQEFNRKAFFPFVTSSATVPTNVLFTTGAEDVWLIHAITPENNHNPGVYTKVIPKAGHHFDLNFPDATKDTPEVLATRALFLHLARHWLGLR
jgi:pimeloyl-ACP methyl ester carboxylesterase